MRNPWLKKNPALSLFLSASNAWLGVARVEAARAIKRQQTAAMKAAVPAKKGRKWRAF